MERIWHIYKICFPNGKAYIGLSVKGARKRFSEHCDAAKHNSEYAVHRAIRKYGQENCTVEILAECCSEKEAMMCEKGLICSHNTFLNGGSGYNMTLGGEFGIVAEEVLQRRILANIGKHSQPHKIARLLEMAARKRGVKLSEEVRANIARGHIGIRPSKESIEKRKLWWQNNGHTIAVRSGYKHSEQTLEKMRAAANARTDRPEHLSDEHKDRISSGNKQAYKDGRSALNQINEIQRRLKQTKPKTTKKMSPEHRAAMSLAAKGKPKSTEHIAALKRASQQRWARFKEEKVKLLARMLPAQEK